MKCLIYVDNETINEELVRRITSGFEDCNLTIAIKDDSIINSNLSYPYVRVPSKRNYSIFRMSLDSLVQEILKGFRFNLFSKYIDMADILKYDLLFSLEDKFHPYWIIKYLTEWGDYDRYVFIFGFQSVRQYIHLVKLRKSLTLSNVCVKLQNDSHPIHLISSMLKGWVFNVRSTFYKLQDIIFRNKLLDATKYKNICLEGYSNSLKMSVNFFLKSKSRQDTLYILARNSLRNDIPLDQSFVSIEPHKNKEMSTARKVYKDQIDFKRKINNFWTNSSNYSLFQSKNLFKFFYKEFKRLTIEAIALSMVYNKLFRGCEFRRTMLTTNFANIFSRVFCLKYPGSNTIYLQHGLFPLHTYLFSFPHKSVLLWGCRYVEFANRNHNTISRVINIGKIGKGKSSKESVTPQREPRNNLNVDLLYFASRPGGSNVSFSLHYYILDMINCLALEKPDLRIVVKLHPADKLDYSKFLVKDITVIRNEKVDVLIGMASTIAFTSSTTGLESLDSNARLLWINPIYPTFSDMVDYTHYNIPLIKESADLNSIFENTSIGALNSELKNKIKKEYFADFDQEKFMSVINN